MYDAKGRELKKGDVVMVPCIVQDIYPSPNYCNVRAGTVATGPPDHAYPTVVTLNAVQLLRANPGDGLDYEVIEDGKARIVR